MPDWPAPVKVITSDGAVRWLDDPPESSIGGAQRWRLVDNRAAAGVWPWPKALEYERAARQPWRRQYATIERVNPGPPPVFRADLGDTARAVARECGIPDADEVAWVSYGLSGPLFGYRDDRDSVLLPPIVAAS